MGTPACVQGSFPLLNIGSKGVYVFVLQDALNAVGYTGSGLDGVYGAATARAVSAFQTAQGLGADGITGCNTWNALTSAANGIGLTSTVVNP
jgi:peptidoglycan hydrolase-like protein with peptidoglycan-binding domain